jgi:5-dehydro-4-deoxyglucarate dehydratase
VEQILDKAKHGHRRSATSPEELKHALSDGLLSFPLTCFDEVGDLDLQAYRRRLEWMEPYGPSVMFAAGGTGEGFSLTGEEHRNVINAAVETCSRTPIVAGVGGATRVATEQAVVSEVAGAAGILLMPHYLTEAGQEGLIRHIEQICRSVSVGVVVYNRGQCRLDAESVARLADRCSNFVALKDGFGDIELLVSIASRMGDRIRLVGGLPTAEVYAGALFAIPVNVYSSAVFNFIPRTALEFYRAARGGNEFVTRRLLEHFFLPFVRLRNRSPGYAVSLIKAGARVVGRPAGPVRTPLMDCTPEEHDQLRSLIDSLGPQ